MSDGTVGMAKADSDERSGGSGLRFRCLGRACGPLGGRSCDQEVRVHCELVVSE